MHTASQPKRQRQSELLTWTNLYNEHKLKSTMMSDDVSPVTAPAHVGETNGRQINGNGKREHEAGNAGADAGTGGAERAHGPIIYKKVMRPTAETMSLDLQLMCERQRGRLTAEDALEIERLVLLAVEEPLDLTPDAQVSRISNAIRYIEYGHLIPRKQRKYNSAELEAEQAAHEEKMKLLTLMDDRSHRDFQPSFSRVAQLSEWRTRKTASDALVYPSATPAVATPGKKPGPTTATAASAASAAAKKSRGQMSMLADGRKVVRTLRLVKNLDGRTIHTVFNVLELPDNRGLQGMLRWGTQPDSAVGGETRLFEFLTDEIMRTHIDNFKLFSAMENNRLIYDSAYPGGVPSAGPPPGSVATPNPGTTVVASASQSPMPAVTASPKVETTPKPKAISKAKAKKASPAPKAAKRQPSERASVEPAGEAAKAAGGSKRKRVGAGRDAVVAEDEDDGEPATVPSEPPAKTSEPPEKPKGKGRRKTPGPKEKKKKATKSAKNKTSPTPEVPVEQKPTVEKQPENTTAKARSDSEDDDVPLAQKSDSARVANGTPVVANAELPPPPPLAVAASTPLAAAMAPPPAVSSPTVASVELPVVGDAAAAGTPQQTPGLAVPPAIMAQLNNFVAGILQQRNGGRPIVPVGQPVITPQFLRENPQIFAQLQQKARQLMTAQAQQQQQQAAAAGANGPAPMGSPQVSGQSVAGQQPIGSPVAAPRPMMQQMKPTPEEITLIKEFCRIANINPQALPHDRAVLLMRMAR
ncbi:Transcription factor spt20, partial [Linderina macrospora]